MPNEAAPTAVALLALMKLKGIGRRGAVKLLPVEYARLTRRELRAELSSRLANSRVDPDALRLVWPEAEAMAKRATDSNVHVVGFHDPEYPEKLRNIPDPPAVLYVVGLLCPLKQKSVAVVGTREPTSYGEKVAFRSGASAVEAGLVVVSGLALGCDTLGHRGCLSAQGTGVAVLAHGLDRVYPASNRDLADALIDGGGCLVSEYPVGMKPMRTAFAERDRIQSGLSDGVLVIETAEKGGTMHTVRFAGEQGRPLACITHPPHLASEPKTQGNQMLIHEGRAMPIHNTEDLFGFYRSLIADDKKCRETTGESMPDPTNAVQMGWAF